MFNNENDNEYINIEKILPNDDILKNDYSFKDEEEYEGAINYDNDSDNSEENKNKNDNIILSDLNEESTNNNIGNILLKYQTILRDLSLDE